MPLNPVVHSPGALALAKAAIESHIEPRLGSWDKLADGRGEIGMIPIYSMPVRRLATKQWNRGWRSGWRYFWTHPSLDQGMIVEIVRVGNRKAALGSIAIGPAALHLRAELAALEQRYSRDKRRYRPRILRLPWIGMEAIWLNTDSLRIADRFFSRLDDLSGIALRDTAVSRARAFLDRAQGRMR